MSAAVTRTAVADLLAGEPDTFPWGASPAAGVPVQVELRWDPGDDPFAVRLAFRNGPGTVEWCLARELLATGLLMPAGAADVQLRPYGNELAVRLSNGEQQAWLLFAAWRVAEFLESTYRQVPLGDERLDLGELEQVLRRGLPR